MDKELAFRIVLEKPPAGIDFGLQKGSGSKYETIQKQRSENKDLNFEFIVRIKNNTSAQPIFLGPFAQGSSADRFIYIDIGSCAGQFNTVWSRRLKVPLSGITQDMINEMMTDTNLLLETKVPGTGKDGGPNCATVKPFSGWQLKPL
ncbi:MAG: DUF5990 family protein [Chitinophagaceae bacterium]